MSDLICPICNTESRAIYGDGGEPEPHRLSWCLECCSVLEFSDDLQLIPVTAETLEQTDLLMLTRMNNEVRRLREGMDMSGEVSLEGVADAENHMKEGGIWVAKSFMDILAFIQLSDMVIEVYSNEEGDGEYEVICPEYYSGDRYGDEQ